MLALELEVLAKKYDRFGWDRDRGTASQDRLIMDWIAALQDYPLQEVQAACRAHVAENPKTMPNEGHILAMVLKAREVSVRAFKARLPPPQEPPREVSDDELAHRAKVAADALGKAKYANSMLKITDATIAQAIADHLAGEPLDGRDEVCAAIHAHYASKGVSLADIERVWDTKNMGGQDSAH